MRDSDVLVVLLTAEVMSRPWCILEIHAAVSAGVPIVGVTLRGKGYDHADAQQQLAFLEQKLDRLNPGALQVLQQNGLDPLDAAYLLSNVIPRLITTEINPAASRGTLQGGLIDLVERMRQAFPPEVSIGGQSRTPCSPPRGRPLGNGPKWVQKVQVKMYGQTV